MMPRPLTMKGTRTLKFFGNTAGCSFSRLAHPETRPIRDQPTIWKTMVEIAWRVFKFPILIACIQDRYSSIILTSQGARLSGLEVEIGLPLINSIPPGKG